MFPTHVPGHDRHRIVALNVLRHFIPQGISLFIVNP